MTEKCRGIEYRYGSPVACSAERGKCLFHDAEGKMFPEDAWGRRLPYDEETKRTIDRQTRRSRGYDGGVEDERAAVVAYLRERIEQHECALRAEREAADAGDFTYSKFTEAKEILSIIERDEHHRAEEP